MNLKKRLKYLLPVPVKKALKYVLYAGEDVWNHLRGTHPKGYPPKRLNFVGSAEFKKVGDEFVAYFKEWGGLKASDRVLDIGSGIGRIALPLTSFLQEGGLCGFDIDRRGVTWCQKNITPKHPHFQFVYADLYNKYYNKKGKIRAEEFRFPYEDATFDFAFATSVFTHMLPAEIDRYLSEIQRVLKPGGTAFLTWFSIDEAAERSIQNGTALCRLVHSNDGVAFYSHKNVPEAEVGYKEAWIQERLERFGMGQDLKIYHGRWAERAKTHSYQDITVSRKKA